MGERATQETATWECGCGRTVTVNEHEWPEGWCRIEDVALVQVCCSAQCAVDAIEASRWIWAAQD